MSYSTVLIIIKLSKYLLLFEDSYSNSLPLKLMGILFHFIWLKKKVITETPEMFSQKFLF